MEQPWQLNPAKEKRQCASRIGVIETKRGQTGIHLNALVHLSVFPPPTGNLECSEPTFRGPVEIPMH